MIPFVACVYRNDTAGVIRAAFVVPFRECRDVFLCSCISKVQFKRFLHVQYCIEQYSTMQIWYDIVHRLYSIVFFE